MPAYAAHAFVSLWCRCIIIQPNAAFSTRLIRPWLSHQSSLLSTLSTNYTTSEHLRQINFEGIFAWYHRRRTQSRLIMPRYQYNFASWIIAILKHDFRSSCHSWETVCWEGYMIWGARMNPTISVYICHSIAISTSNSYTPDYSAR